MGDLMQRANDYDVSEGDVHVHYSSTSISGQPLLNYEYGSEAHSFSGDEIRSMPSEIGTVLTVTTEVVYDAYTRTLTVVIPEVNLAGDEAAPCTVAAIDTTSRTSIGGQNLVEGALQSYVARTLSGIARFIVSG